MNNTIKITLDNMSYKEKPSVEEVAKIQTRLKKVDSVKEVTVKDLLNYIKLGHTIIPSIMSGGTKRENWLEQQIFEIDIDNTEDNNIIQAEEVIKLFVDNDLPPFAYYHTFSSTVGKPKFRILFKTAEPITEINKAEFIIKTLVDFAPQADKACTNVSRLFHGTNGEEKEVIMLDENAIITLDDVVKIYTPNNKETTNKKDKDFWDIVKNYDWLDYIKQDNIVDGRESGDRVDFLICPICHHKKDFSYYKSTHSFCCYGVNGNVNGSIIDFLVATKNVTKKEAIDIFKYEFLGMTKAEEKQKYIDDNGVQQEDIMVIQQQLNSINLNAGYIEDANWLDYLVTKNGNLIRSVNCPKLAQFIRENIYYIFVRNNAKSTTLRYFYLDGYYKLVSDDEIKGLIKLCIPLEWQRTKDINEVLNLLYTDLKFVPIEKLNADENIINFNNGVLHLDTMELKPHSPEYLSTIRIPCNYYEYVEAPTTHYFDNFINDLTNGNEEVKQLLLEIMGVTISNIRGYRMKQALFMVGPGNSGKSKLKIFLTSLIGAENCSSIDLKMLQKQFSKIQLLNKRLVGTNDMSWMNLPEIDTFKQATGGDLINAEYKGENGIDFTFNGVLWFCGNKLPRFGGDKGEWTYNRIIVVECNNVIPEEKRDSFLDAHLIEESDYIISLCIKALLRVIKNGYKYDIPEICKLAKKQYEIDNDSFLSFYEECIVDRDPTKPITDYCTKGKIFDVYKAYCKDNNKNHFNTKKEVQQILEKMGKDETTYARGGNIYYKYITLSKEANIEYGDICPWPQPDITAADIGLDEQNYDF